MVNYFILVNGIIKMTEIVTPEQFFIELCTKSMGVGLNLTLLKDY